MRNLGSVASCSVSREVRTVARGEHRDSVSNDGTKTGVFHQDSRRGVPAFYAFVPEDAPGREDENADLPLVVCVHGISRDAREQIELLRPVAQSRGYALLAPHFEETVYSDYQRLGRRGHGPRADLALLAARSKFETLIGRQFETFSMMGFSGGSQFVHRFVMAHPDKVTAAVCASAGWYSFPDSRKRYPRGLRVGGTLPGIRFDPNAFLRVPLLVCVGSMDTIRDDSVRTNRRLDETQGLNRVERARNWSQSMRAAAEQRGLANLTSYIELRRMGHSFRECVEHGLDELGFDFFEAVRTGNPK